MAVYCYLHSTEPKRKKKKPQQTVYFSNVCYYTTYQHTTLYEARDTPTSEICMTAMLIELDYNVMAHAWKTIFMYGQNGQVHILLQQVGWADSSVPCWQLISVLEWLETDLLILLSCFPFTPLFHADLYHDIVIEQYH
jgi:ABC-type siderophore export system fused ATPase/permease subunit